MRIIAGLSAFALLTVRLRLNGAVGRISRLLQSPKTKVVTASEVAALVAGTPKDRNGNGNFIRLTPYNVNMEHRIMGQAASVHETEAELFYT